MNHENPTHGTGRQTAAEGDRYFVCHAGGDEPNDPTGTIGRIYVWKGGWIRSPEEVAHRERNPTMKLFPLWANDPFVVDGDIGCFTEVSFYVPSST